MRLPQQRSSMPSAYLQAWLVLRHSRKLASCAVWPIDCSPPSFRPAVAGPSIEGVSRNEERAEGTTSE